MNLNSQTLNLLFQKYHPIVDSISEKYHYPDNIKHLLYLIIPAFVIKYKVAKENLVLECFQKIPIFVTGKEDPRIQALYNSIPSRENDHFITTKRILLNRYDQIPLMQLVDNLVHEFNHAMNSIKNEITWNDSFLYIRTGLTRAIYQKETLTPLRKEDTYILEEMMNTKQTEAIIDLINSFSNYDIENTEINNTLYAIKHSVPNQYTSSAYLWHTYYSKQLLENRTFFSTLETLRLEGEITEIENWFNQITGSKESYAHLIALLLKIAELEKQEATKKGFAWLRKKRIKETVLELDHLITTFNQNCNYT